MTGHVARQGVEAAARGNGVFGFDVMPADLLEPNRLGIKDRIDLGTVLRAERAQIYDAKKLVRGW